MMKYQKLVNQAKADWKEYEVIFQACKNIIIASEDKSPSQWSHLTFSSIGKIANINLSTDEVVAVAQYLSGERIRLFNASLEYISEDESESFVLSEDNCQYIISDNVIEHPLTGELIQQADDKVFMFFSLLAPIEVTVDED